MLLNAKTAISTSKVLLVPYSPWHVPRYHEWMKDEEIQAATASEPLSLEDEYAMQQSWRQDADKLTFIICVPVPAQDDNVVLKDADDAPSRMLGDVNLFIRVEDDDDDGGQKIIGEIELMIAEKRNQGRGFGRAALLVFLRYVGVHEGEILREFGAATTTATTGARFAALSVKIGAGNVRSLALFESLGFVKVVEEPSYFGEFELRWMGLGRGVEREMERVGVEGYVEVSYERCQ